MSKRRLSWAFAHKKSGCMSRLLMLSGKFFPTTNPRGKSGMPGYAFRRGTHSPAH